MAEQDGGWFKVRGSKFDVRGYRNVERRTSNFEPRVPHHSLAGC